MAETISIDIGILQGIFGDLTRLQTQLSGVAGVAGTLDATMGNATAGLRQSLSGVTGAVQSVESATDAAMRGMVGDIMGPLAKSQELNDKLVRLGREMNTAKSVNEVSRLKKEIAATQRELDGVNASGMERKVSGAAGRMRSMFAGLAGPVAGAFAVGGVVGFTRSIVQAVAGAESFNASMKVMLGGQEQATKMSRELREFAVATPFDIAGLRNYTTQLKAYGSSADEIIPTLDILGNIAAGVGADKLPQLVRAFGQVQSKGKLMGGELLQLTETGIPILEELSKITGKSTSEISGNIAEMGIPFETVRQAMANMTAEGGKFHNLMAEQSKTIGGQLAAAGEEWQGFLEDVGTALLPQITGAVNLFKGALDGVRVGFSWVQENGQAIKDVIAGLTLAATAYGGILFWNNRQLIHNNALKAIAVLRDGAMALWTGLTTTAVAGATTAQWSWNAALLANPIGIVIGVLAGLVAGVIWAWNRFEGFRAFLYGLWAAVKSVFFGIKDIVTTVFGSLVDIVAGFGKTLIGAITLDPALVKEGITQGAKGIRDAMSVTDKIKGLGLKAGLAYAQGDAEGRASFRADQEEAAAAEASGTTNAKDYAPGNNVGADALLGGTTPGAPAATGGAGATVSGSGGGDKNIAMNITMNMQFGIGRDVQTSARDTAEQVVAMITNKLRDAQFALG